MLASSIIELILEAPVDSYTTIPADPEEFRKQRRRGWSDVDRNLVTHPVAIRKVKDSFAALIDYSFHLYFAAVKGGHEWVETGAVDPKVLSGIKLDNIEPDPSGISVIYVGNQAGDKVPLTAWTMAHRFAHAISRSVTEATGLTGKGEKIEWSHYIVPSYRHFRDDVENTLKYLAGSALPKPEQDYAYSPYSQYGKPQRQDNPDVTLKHLGHDIGTMKSARDKKLRNADEFAHELFAQYLMQGKITLKQYAGQPDKAHLATRKFSYGKPSLRRTGHTVGHANEVISRLERDLNHAADYVLRECVGHVFVM